MLAGRHQAEETEAKRTTDWIRGVQPAQAARRDAPNNNFSS
jgi:hypothetical protein